MKTTSQPSGHKFPFSSGHDVMDNRTLYVTLAWSIAVAFTFTLIEYYAMQGRSPFNRLGYAVFISVLPAVGVWGVLKLTKLLLSWRGAVFLYVVFFVVVWIIQNFGRRIPVYI